MAQLQIYKHFTEKKKNKNNKTKYPPKTLLLMFLVHILEHNITMFLSQSLAHQGDSEFVPQERLGVFTSLPCQAEGFVRAQSLNRNICGINESKRGQRQAGTCHFSKSAKKLKSVGLRDRCH